MSIEDGAVGATYTARGMIFVVLGFDGDGGTRYARCALLDDHPSFTKRIAPGTVMNVQAWSSVWRESIQLSSPSVSGRVVP